jgi:hypothetical protein
MAKISIADLSGSTDLRSETMRRVHGGLIASWDDPRIYSDWFPKLPSPAGDYLPSLPGVRLPFPHPFPGAESTAPGQQFDPALLQ